jgi:uncharacterized protein (TIGR02285 family)
MKPSVIDKVVLSFILLAWAAVARAEDSITWMLPEFPPASIPVDGKPGNGITDELMRYIMVRLPDTEHLFLQSNSKRMWAKIAAGDKVCSASAIRTPEREKISYFTPTHLLPPHHLIVREAMVKSLPINARGEVELSKMIANPRLRGLLVDHRSYGLKIDALIHDRPANSGIILSAQGNLGASFLPMIMLERSDYTIEYDFVTGYLMSKNPGLRTLRSLPIAENNKAIIGGIACPRTAWGRATIERIDRIIGTPEAAQAMRRGLDVWMTEGTRLHYLKEIDAFYRKRALPLNPADF